MPRLKKSTTKARSAKQESILLEGEIIKLMPSLHAFSRTLTRNPTDADDLLQEGLLKALVNIHQFTPGTNLKAWMFTIVRNTFYTNYKKKRREVAAPLEETGTVSTEATQEWTLTMEEVNEAMEHLPGDQKQALMLVGTSGMSYERAAEVCGCALGTIKSRVSRGRTKLRELLVLEARENLL
jgi:RNA polymerase sigma-70 factor (ECF subfamily)